jgi:hypothetical protein
MDFFQSHQTVPKPLLSSLLHIPERSIALVKTTGWFTKGAEIDPNLHANKVLLKVAHAFLYTLMDFFQSRKLCPKLLSYLLPFFERSIALVKRLAGSPRAEIDRTCLNKVLLKVHTHSYIH